MLKIKNLKADIESKSILNNFNLEIKPGEVHAIMGPNGSGKSTLSNILSGKKGYNISGEILFENKNIFELETEERAHKGIFLAFQYPLEIPGVNTNIFLKTSLNPYPGFAYHCAGMVKNLAPRMAPKIAQVSASENKTEFAPSCSESFKAWLAPK